MFVMEKTTLWGTGPHFNVFLHILRTPIARGLDAGIVGNGRQTMTAWAIFDEMESHGRNLSIEDWKRLGMDLNTLEEKEVNGMLDEIPSTVYYDCPTCRFRGKSGFL